MGWIALPQSRLGEPRLREKYLPAPTPGPPTTCDPICAVAKNSCCIRLPSTIQTTTHPARSAGQGAGSQVNMWTWFLPAPSPPAPCSIRSLTTWHRDTSRQLSALPIVEAAAVSQTGRARRTGAHGLAIAVRALAPPRAATEIRPTCATAARRGQRDFWLSTLNSPLSALLLVETGAPTDNLSP
jgi:hypothetical protein